ncbi:MAG: hypothetical protein ACOC1P_00925 [Minisyncoccales bacterium]
MGDIYIQLKKQHLIILGCIISIFGIVLITNAYGGGYGNPQIMGHSADEIDVDFGGNTESVQNVFNSIDTNSDGVIDDAEYANSAGAVDWNNVNNKPDVATKSWVEDKDYATEDYVDSEINDIGKGLPYACDWNGWKPEEDSLGCGGGCGCDAYGAQTQLYCDGEKITNIRSKSYCVNCIHCSP